jgi:hypothetical protein
VGGAEDGRPKELFGSRRIKTSLGKTEQGEAFRWKVDSFFDPGWELSLHILLEGNPQLVGMEP